jgi:hypothetical protein
MAVKRRRGRREPPKRTLTYRVFEAAGLAIGRSCLRSSDLHTALSAGFTRAVREQAAGRIFGDVDVADAVGELAALLDELRKASGVTRGRRSS